VAAAVAAQLRDASYGRISLRLPLSFPYDDRALGIARRASVQAIRRAPSKPSATDKARLTSERVAWETPSLTPAKAIRARSRVQPTAAIQRDSRRARRGRRSWRQGIAVAQQNNLFSRRRLSRTRRGNMDGENGHGAVSSACQRALGRRHHAGPSRVNRDGLTNARANPLNALSAMW